MDTFTIDGYFYIRVKSDEIMAVAHPSKPDEAIYIVPTDEDQFKLIIIPLKSIKDSISSSPSSLLHQSETTTS